MSDPIYFDTETVGFHGPAVLIQYAIGDGPIHLHEVWKTPILDTLKLIEMFTTHPGGVVGFNLSFDWFHLCQLYTTLLLMSDHHAYLEDCVEEYALNEPLGRDGPCIKPVCAHDIMLHARKGPYQSTMDRKEIRIKKVPTPLAWLLAQELDRRIPIKDIYFAKKKVKSSSHWSVQDIEDDFGQSITDFKDVVLKFAPSSALKALAADALNLKPDAILLFADITPKLVPNEKKGEEIGYAPFALAVGKPGNWKGSWPDCIQHQIDHWAYNKLAREYAEKDVDVTRRLYKHFGSQPLGDDDSELACMVGAVRWRGFSIDPEGLEKLKAEAKARAKAVPTSSSYSMKYLEEVLAPEERLVMHGSTGKIILEELAGWTNVPCPVCEETGRDENHNPCSKCNGAGSYEHPVARRAAEILDARKAAYEINFYDKLLLAGRLHASFVIIGTLSSRMAGTDSLNPQGIKNDDSVRSKFPLAWPGTVLCGGDFSGFEVVLAEACYNDAGLRKDLLTKRPCHKCCKPAHESIGCHHCDNGVVNRDTPEETWCRSCLVWKPKDGCDDCWGTGLTDTKIHALFGQFVYPHMTYEEILADKKIYTRCKSAVFAMLYGGEGFTLKSRLGVSLEVADAAFDQFCRRYPGVGISRQRIVQMFCTLRQPGGIGKAVEWNEPADYIESMFGFRRYFTLENMISRALYDLANKPPAAWKLLKCKVVRRDREQFPVGAVQSALFGATFALQAANMRAGANHVIQSSGAQITKMVQRRIWDLQPSGVNSWVVEPFNVHDEILTPTALEYVDKVAEIVNTTVEELRPQVPLLKMIWNKALESWADK